MGADRFSNVYKIDKLTFDANDLKVICSVGGVEYEAGAEIEFWPDDTIPEFAEMSNKIRLKNGTHMSIEELCDHIIKIMLDYGPRKVTVRAYSSDSRLNHYPVVCMKTLSLEDPDATRKML